MKKVLLAILIFTSVAAMAQPITDTGTLRTYINAEIVTNGTKAITALKMNRILNGYLNAWPNNTIVATSPLAWNPFTRTLSITGWNGTNWNAVYNWWISTGGGNTKRFGFTGEDVTAAENRTFTLGGTYIFRINGVNTSNYFRLMTLGGATRIEQQSTDGTNTGGFMSSATGQALELYNASTSSLLTHTINGLALTKPLTMKEVSVAPGTPATDYGTFYIKASDNKPYFKNDGGTEYDLTAGVTYTAGPGIAFNGNEIYSTDYFKNNYLRNTGASGEGIYTKINDSTFGFKKLVAGANITLTPSDSSIQISAAGGGGGAGTLLKERSFTGLDTLRLDLSPYYGTYSRLVFEFESMRFTAETELIGRVVVSGSQLSGASDYSKSSNFSAPGLDTDHTLFFYTSSDDASTLDGFIEFKQPNGARRKQIRSDFYGLNGTEAHEHNYITTTVMNTGIIDYFIIQGVTGMSGTFKLYGY